MRANQKAFSDPRKTCVYMPGQIYCALPAARGGVPEECAACGWNPAVDAKRKRERRVYGRVLTKPKKAEETDCHAGRAGSQ